MEGISYRDVHGIADELGVDVQTVRRWIHSGKLRAFKPGKEYRVREADLEEFLAAREVRPKAPGRSSLEPSLDDLEHERTLRHVRAWRAYLGDLFIQWTEEGAPKAVQIREFLSLMNRLVEQGAFDTSAVSNQLELEEISMLMTLLRNLNEIADSVEADETPEERWVILRALEDQIGA